MAKDATAFLTTAVESAATLEQATTVEAPVESASATKKIVAITACPTGVAHTFMAAEALEEEANAVVTKLRWKLVALLARRTN